jgi:hypothetical protein
MSDTHDDIMPNDLTIEERVSNLEEFRQRADLALFGRERDPKIDGIEKKLDRLEAHARRQDEHNAKQEKNADRQRWIIIGMVAGLTANGLTLATVLRLAATVAGGATP